MKQRLVGIIILLAVAGVVAGITWQERASPAARQDRMVLAFLEVIPDSLDSEHRLEIQQLFRLFYLRAARGEVASEDVKRINDQMAVYIDRGRITPTDLLHFMADVGYTTYKSDPHYNLSDQTVDHPTLNPASAMYSMRFDSVQYDSAFWADFEKWKKEHPELTDSLFDLENPPPKP
jgi:hypothetical protein